VVHRAPLVPAIAVLGALVVPAGCGEARRPSVFLISIDTLRADHLGCYGYSRDTTPRLDEFRRDATLFEQAIAQAPSTLPSHASLFTSLLPAHHGASIAESSRLDPRAVTLAQVLKSAGYETGSFNGGIQLDPIYGLASGFDTYVPARPSTASAHVLVDPVDRLDHAVSEALSWMRARKEKPLFLFLHTYEIHHPYTPDRALLRSMDPDYGGPLGDEITVELLSAINDGRIALEKADLDRIVAAYDAELRSVDAAFGSLVDFLRREGLYNDAMIIVTSDHGEEFGEHGTVGWHAHSLYDELLRVPLLVKLPGSRQAGESVAAQVRGIDLAPTILDELRIPIPASFEGASLLSAMSGAGGVPEEAVSQKDVVLADETTSIRTPTWKLSRKGLFHLPSDPLESQDVRAANPGTVRALSEALERHLNARPRPPVHRVEPDPELLRKLRSLGYVQ
jgi:arylsulfatase A-like enzyme